MRNILHFYHSLSIRDRRVVFFVVLGALLLSSLPYLFGPLLAGQHFTYLGMYPTGPGDTNVYFSFIRQAMQGKVLFENLHTGEPQHGTIFHPLWLILGWGAALFRLSPVLLFHVARAVLGGIFLLFFYYFLSFIFSDSRRRNIAFVLAAFSSGIGVFFSIGLSIWDPISGMLLLPADQWITESNTFLTLMHSPLFILAQLLLLVLFWLFLQEATIKNFFLVGGLFLLLVLLHPYDLLTIAIVLPSFILVRILRDPTFTPEALRRALKRLVLLAVCAVPPILAYLVAARSEVAIGGWMKRNITMSPPIHSYLLGYGLLLAFAVAGFVALRKSRSPFHLFLLTWVVVSGLLLYIPMQFNRRMSNGLHVPIVILAAVGIDLLWRWVRTILPRREMLRTAVRASFLWVVGIGLFFTTITLTANAISWEWNPAESIYYLPRGVADGMDWLGSHADPQAVILSHAYNGNIFPARTGLRVYIGHGHQTVDYETKQHLVNTWFFRTDRDDAAKEHFLNSNNIAYLFFSHLEDALGTYQPSEKPYLEAVYTNSNVTIYHVRR
ncbi:MAG: hypothetical protein V1778_00280 [bacterium]